MAHETELIATVAVGIGLAFVFGLGAARRHIPPLVGYILAGVVIGPFTPCYVANAGLARQLAEIGVILLMFGVGLHFSVTDLRAMRRVALPGAVAQMVVTTALGLVAACAWNWSVGAGVVFGLSLSVSSTVVLLRELEQRGLVATVEGRVAIGWLVVEDVATVVVLVLLPAIAAVHAGVSRELWRPLGLALAKLAAFVAIMLVVGRRIVPWLLERVARIGSRELFTLAVLSVSLGVAVGASALFGVSFSLGAFLAGTVVNGSRLSHRAAMDALPLRDAFAVLFFVAVGMLFDPSILVRHPLQLAVVIAIVVGKSFAGLAIARALGSSRRTALMLWAGVAQIGEFSFIVAAVGTSLGLLPTTASSFIVAAAILTIAVNPAAFWLAGRLASEDRARPVAERSA
jgi:CPA2 family monovalent cation:H+ antiporter-2